MTELKKWLFNNIDIKLLALIMAIVLWFYISSEYNLSGERYYDIEIRPINLGENLSIKEIRDKVSVGLQGPKKILDNISSKKIIGTVDLKDIEGVGEYQLGVNVVVPKYTEIVQIIPKEIDIIVEKIIKKEFIIEYNLIGLPEKGYSLKSEPEINPQEVVISGPESLLKKVKQVKIDIDISSIQDNLNTEENVVVYNTENAIMEDIKVSPEVVSVFIEVKEGYPEKTLPVKPRIIGKPAPGYFISRIEANPNNLNIFGNYSKIGKLGYLETIPIDVNGVTKTITVKVPPILGEGIYLNDSQPSLIEVQIQIEEKEEEKIFKNIPIEPREASPFLDYQLNPDLVDVIISGKYDNIKDLKDEDIKAFVDLSDLEEEKLKVEIELPPETNLVKIIPEDITISMKK